MWRWERTRHCRGIWCGDVDFSNGRRTPIINLWPRMLVFVSPMLRIGGGGLLTPTGASRLKVRVNLFLRIYWRARFYRRVKHRSFKLWDNPATSKVIVFSLQLPYDRVPTKVNLRLRGIIPLESSSNCVWCLEIGESSSHLFIHCKVALFVWYEIFKWLGVVTIIPPNLSLLFDCLSEAARSKKFRNGFRLVWNAVIWTLWKARNNYIFNNIMMDPVEVGDYGDCQNSVVAMEC
ncbi:hypothetical protein TSUD_400780 [Trifolium subterraneum]|uniref:Reverse transcriptase zinc-binding domain-containing protein n=1 Tax=Trifolium subterraneum TaxID=3900 RepID=A0A2Z6NND7_TRISU|nr:hypothetical protein TSUD_400780 [Trifolium subterraneum]